ncbi:FAD-dependent monooxygenase [Micromonospora olivasterospora]|uniref:2-polyprenyl-6-methoxyphenol hydroxylase-like FAD-dependent oxidoreductase n=1 Tax=Micromonospora olivasterospora TaxID=1880 RepID=A0A562IFY2_MICOL|nr:FAD-dependent monooxygenase [Micromonospora olivasterospora]TWH69907.1 2-polyprenyl-6-methoxyphenol hydroxylase-like FAD-dependent oxidoreductase [Micromonospora olivasterospora]
MNLTRPILVTGAGVGGLTAALALARHGFAVQVYERRELEEITANAGFGHTIWSNATTSLRTIGVGERLLARAEPMLGFESRNSRQQVMFRTNTADSIWPGCAPTVGIGRGDLIGADGIRSTILEQLHGRIPAVYTGRSTYRGIAPGACGLKRGTVHLFSDPDSRFGGGAWLIGGDRVVWTLSCERTPGTEDPQGIPAWAREIADVLRGPAPTFVRNTSQETISRIDVYYHEWLDRWGEGPVTLLGDAAHALPTDLGQGACMAIEDGVVLADCLATAVDVHSGLREYERRRRERVHWVREHVLRVNRFKPIRNKALRWVVGKIAKVVVASSAPKMWREVQRPPELTAERS